MRLARNNILHDTVSNFKGILQFGDLVPDLWEKQTGGNKYMPLYEYQCKKCEKKFETLVSLKDRDDPAKCPDCGSEDTDKLMSTFSASVGSSARSASCSMAGST